jgi:TolB protein
MLLALLQGCTCGTQKPPAITYTIAVSPKTASVAIAATTPLTAVIHDNTGATVSAAPTWTTSAAAIATVGASGVVTGVAAGSASITAAYANVTDSAAITVTVAAPVFTVTIAPPSATLLVGATQRLVATVKDQTGATVTAQVTWQSDHPEHAQVDASGLVTAIAAGGATITASSSGASATAAITVNAPQQQGGISLQCISPAFLDLGNPAGLGLFIYGDSIGANVDIQIDGQSRGAATVGANGARTNFTAPDYNDAIVHEVTYTGIDGGTSNPLPFVVREGPAGYPLIVTTAPGGGPSDGGVNDFALSEDGRYLAVTEKLNGSFEVFLRDTCRGASACTPSVMLASTADGGSLAPGSFHSSISGSGRYVAFNASTPLVPGDPVGTFHSVYLRDTCAGATGCAPSTQLISRPDDGGVPNDNSDAPVVSGTGRFVVFLSAAALTDPNPAGINQVFLRDTCAGATGCAPSTTRISVAVDGGPADQDSYSGTSDFYPLAAVSDDGRYVAFSSEASNLVDGDTNDDTDVFLRDTCRGASGCTPSTLRVSRASDGGEIPGQSIGAAMSADGRFVAFHSGVDGIVPDDSNGSDDVFLRDTCNGASGCTPSTTALSRVCGFAPGGGASSASMSADGRFIAFMQFNGPTRYLVVRDTCSGAVGCIPSTVMHPKISETFGLLSGDGKTFAFRAVVPGASTDQLELGATLFFPP